MKYDEDKVDEMALALMYLGMSTDRHGTRAWKGLAWEITDRLHRKGWISDPGTKALSVAVSEEGRKKAEQLFRKHFRSPEGVE